MVELPIGFHGWRWFRKWGFVRKRDAKRDNEMGELLNSIARTSDVDRLRWELARNAKEIREKVKFRKALLRELRKKKGKWPWDYNEQKKVEERIKARKMI